MKIIDVKCKSKRIAIAPLGDIQYGNEGFSESTFSRAVQRLKAHKGELYVVGTGDYIDALSPSNRAGYRASGLYSSSKRLIQSQAIEPLVRKLGQKLLPIVKAGGKFVTLCVGHHWFHYDWTDCNRKAVEKQFAPHPVPGTSDVHLAQILGTSTTDGFALINFQMPGGVFRVLVWHGVGNGQTLGYGANRLAKLAGGWEGIDAIFMGHTHRLGATGDTRLYYDADKHDLSDRNVVLINAGSFLRAYKKDEMVYPERFGLNALALGHSLLQVARRGNKWDLSVELKY